MKKIVACLILMACIILTACMLVQSKSSTPAPKYLSPCALASSKTGIVYVALGTANRIAVVDSRTNRVLKQISVVGQPTGLALSKDGNRLYVTCDQPQATLTVINTTTGKVISVASAGHGATGPVVSAKTNRLFVCNRYDNTVSAIDLRSQKQIASVKVGNEPIAAAIDASGSRLVVANLLPSGASDADYVGAAVDIIDARQCKRLARIQLPNGSTCVRGVCVSPDGEYAFITHTLGRYTLPTTQLDRGWMNTNAVSIIDVRKQQILNTFLLDDVDWGAANPWAVGCASDGKSLVVTHAGTNEISIIDLPALLSKLKTLPKETPDLKPKLSPEEDNTGLSLEQLEKNQMPYDAVSVSNVQDSLSFLRGIRKRVYLPAVGPRALTIIGSRVYVANYFSDSLSVVDIAKSDKVSSIELGPALKQTEARRGEMLFNDASICYQSWQSCASCHPDVRADSLNWDLLNDGMGNSKNTKSLLLSHRTPPVMSTGIRKNAETAVRSGLRFIHFAVRPESDAVAIDEYLKSLQPVPSPRLVNGTLSKSAQRGRKVFEKAGCSSCHSGPYFTDLKSYDIGTGEGQDAGRAFDTPTLREVWRTAPYLHTGKAVTIKDVVTKCNPGDSHGSTSKLSKKEISDLVEYVSSL